MNIKEWLINVLEQDEKKENKSSSPIGKLPKATVYYPKGYVDYVSFLLKNLDIVDVIENNIQQESPYGNTISIVIDIPLTYIAANICEARYNNVSKVKEI